MTNIWSLSSETWPTPKRGHHAYVLRKRAVPCVLICHWPSKWATPLFNANPHSPKKLPTREKRISKLPMMQMVLQLASYPGYYFGFTVEVGVNCCSSYWFEECPPRTCVLCIWILGCLSFFARFNLLRNGKVLFQCHESTMTCILSKSSYKVEVARNSQLDESVRRQLLLRHGGNYWCVHWASVPNDIN